MRKFSAGIALLAAAAAAPAFAQEAAPFTGAHIEALGGYDNVEGDDGFAYGVGAGFDFQAGSVILGVEGEFMDSTTGERGRSVFTAGDTLRTDAARDLYVGGRIGFEVAPGTLLYGKAGYTNARFKTRYNNGAGVVTSSGNNLDGYRLGAGIEKKFALFGPSGFVKAEYRFSNYDNLNVGGANIDIDADRHQGIVGVGVRF